VAASTEGPRGRFWVLQAEVESDDDSNVELDVVGAERQIIWSLPWPTVITAGM
jgi:hypothetical protein